jgi:hypothetical protein
MHPRVLFINIWNTLKVINHLAHENPKDPWAQNQQFLKIVGKVIKFRALSIYSTTYVFRTCQKNTFSVTVGGGIDDFTYQIIWQSIFMTKQYELQNNICN